MTIASRFSGPVTSERPLRVENVVAWAEAFFLRSGKWPDWQSGPIPGSRGETWFKVAGALALGGRGLPRAGSLSRFVAERRGLINPAIRNLSVDQILDWADAWIARTGRRPLKNAGEIPDSGGLTWNLVDSALRKGDGFLPQDSSLETLLRAARPVRPRRPPVTEEQILFWADAFYARSGRWPIVWSGPIPEAPGETWQLLDAALRGGFRTLPGGSSLSRLLVSRRGAEPPVNARSLHLLSVPEILAWADAHHLRHGKWPTCVSGPIPEAPHRESWRTVHDALKTATRGLPDRTSLSQLLKQTRGVLPSRERDPFSTDLILAWADAHHSRTGEWPNQRSGPIPESAGATWRGVHCCFIRGARGLPRGTSLALFLAEKRGLRHQALLPELRFPQIMAWALAYRDRNGRWPNERSGAILECPGETWFAVDRALRDGRRGLPGDLSLSRLTAGMRRRS